MKAASRSGSCRRPVVLAGPLFAALIATMSAVLPHTAGAQATSNPAAVKEAPLPESVQRLYRASDILGASLRDRQQRKVGEIRDLLLDPGRGEIAYVIATFSETSGKYHPLPWRLLQPDLNDSNNKAERAYLLQADRETRLEAPGFRRDAWPDLTDRGWSREVDRYWSRMMGRDAGKANQLPPPPQSPQPPR